MDLETKKVPFTGQELSKVIDFLKDKETISLGEIQREFKKGYNWTSIILDTLEELHIISEFQGQRDRTVLIRSDEADA